MPGGAGWVRDLEERETFRGSLCTFPHPQQSSDPRETQGEAETGAGQAEGECLQPAEDSPGPGCVFRSHKGGNGSERGSARSRSPGEKVGEGTRTRALATPGSHSIPSLGQRLRSRELLRDRDGERRKETIETEIESDVERETERSNRDSERGLSLPESQSYRERDREIDTAQKTKAQRQ